MSKRLQSAKIYLEQGDFQKAIQELKVQISSNNNDVQALFLRGVALRKSGKLELSLIDFNKVIQLEPQRAELYCERAILFHMMGNYDFAIADMNAGVRLEPENPFRYSSRAYIRERAKDTEGAIEDYQKAIQIDPEDEISLNNLGLLQEKIGRMKEAKKNFDKSDNLLKAKGKYVVNESTKGLQKDELEITTDPSGKVSFKSSKIKEDEITGNKLSTENSNQKISLKSYFETLLVVFSSKGELNSFFDFIRSFFSSKKS